MASVSIIIRTFNEEYWIPFLIHALEGQTFKDYEIICVDNYSDDKSVKLISECKECKAITYIRDYLPGKALNRGCEEANGSIFVKI